MSDSSVPAKWIHPGLNLLTKPLYDPPDVGPKLPPQWPEVFLNHLAMNHNVSKSLREAGVSRGTAYSMRKTNELFSLLWDEALEMAIDDLEARAYNRAMGIEPQGVGDDAMVRWFLARTRPDKFGDKSQVDLRSGDGSMTPQVAIFQLPDNNRGDTEYVDITEDIIDHQLGDGK